MNLLCVGAAYGVMTAVFQWGWGAELLGIDHAVPVSSWLPILMFTILFGLSMDYEVFLLSRIREDYDRTGDPRGSVVRGLASTSRRDHPRRGDHGDGVPRLRHRDRRVVKMLGVGMGVAILLDATVVRMVLVPATMACSASATGGCRAGSTGCCPRPGRGRRPRAGPRRRLRPTASPSSPGVGDPSDEVAVPLVAQPLRGQRDLPLVHQPQRVIGVPGRRLGLPGGRPPAPGRRPPGPIALPEPAQAECPAYGASRS